MFQGFLQSRLKWGLNIEQPPCYQAQSEVLTQSLGLVNDFSTATVLSNVGKRFMNSKKLRSFLRLMRHTSIQLGQTLMNCALWLIGFFCGELPPIFVVYLGLKTKNTSKIYYEYLCLLYLPSLVGIWMMNIYVSLNWIFELKVDVCNVWRLVCKMCTDQHSLRSKLLSCHSQLASVWDEGGDSRWTSPSSLDCLSSWRKRRNTKRRTSNSGPHQKYSWRGKRRRELRRFIKLTIKQHLDVIVQVIACY